MFKSTLILFRSLASLKLTLPGILLLVVGILVSYFDQNRTVVWLVLPLVVLSVNLLAAIVFNPRIRKNSGLLMFHLCLLAIALLASLSQMTSMKAHVRVVEGTLFDASAVTVDKQGPWHSLDALSEVAFVQGDIQVSYTKGLRRGVTRSWLQLRNREVLIGDNTPYRHNNYRFYTTSNKGFAAILNWYDANGSLVQGSISFPSYPLYDWKQKLSWKTPSGEELKFELVVDTPLAQERDWMLDSKNYNGYLQVTMADGSAHTLRAGDTVELAGGRLAFETMRMWMGYRIFYDPWLVWFFAVAVVGVTGLGWHYYLRLCTPRYRVALATTTMQHDHAISATRS